jgi:hypothetical protein
LQTGSGDIGFSGQTALFKAGNYPFGLTRYDQGGQ